MPLIKSAKKRVRVANKAAVRNSKTKRSLKTTLKAFHKAVGGDKKATASAHASAQSVLDKAVKKGLVHKNKAARTKRKLATKSKAANTAKPTTKRPAARKTTTKK